MNRIQRKEAYREFLKSHFWKELTARKKVLQPECEECGSKKKLSSHHWRYPEDWYQTTLEDLEVLCWRCHRRRHGRSVPGDFEWARYGIEMKMSCASRIEDLPATETMKEMARLAKDEEEIRRAAHLVRTVAEMRMVISSSRMWTLWLKKYSSMKDRFWDWSEETVAKWRQER